MSHEVDPADDEYIDVETEFAKPDLTEALERLTTAQRDNLGQYWVDRADGELTTALTFEFMLDDLEQLGAPAELRELATAAILDEHRHVDWCVRWADRVRGTKGARASFRGTRPLTFAGASERDNRLLRTVFGCAFSETVAIHVLRESHARITVPSVRRLNHLHMKEEVGHARLGWALLGWEGVTDTDRRRIRDRVPELTAVTRDVWTSTHRTPDEALHAFGFLSSEIVEAALEEAMNDVVTPGLLHVAV